LHPASPTDADRSILGFICATLTPSYFITTQLPAQLYASPAAKVVLEDVVAQNVSARLISSQLGNAYLLLCLLGVFILNTTTEIKVVRAYLWALLIADVGHVGLTVVYMGWSATLAVGSWSGAAFGNVGITSMLFAVRCAYLAGYFDAPGAAEVAVHKPKSGRAKASKKTTSG
jgi:hypothetical protein